MVTRKTEYKDVDGTPQKRVFLSIINDYDLITGLCELIDNSIDMWVASGREKDLEIAVELDSDRQLIVIQDNAGGVKEEELEFLVSPGASGQGKSNKTIGVFGVGGKRAGIALGELVEIKSRYEDQKSLQIDITKEWLATDDWAVSVYQIPDISQNTTKVEISKLRRSFNDDQVFEIIDHLEDTYAKFLTQNCEIKVNEKNISGKFFDVWAYPPKFPPRSLEFDVSPVKDKNLKVRITAGLIVDRDAEKENYGAYFYCNDRLVLKELRTRDVGYYVTTEAGVPHPDASLCRAIVELNGDASLMPWNSSKSDLNFSHPVFLELRPSLIDLISFFSKLSRRLKLDWENEVFEHKSGTLESVASKDIKASGKLIYPELPRVRSLPYTEELIGNNRKVIKDKPWTLGLIESMGLVDTIERQSLETKNRAALILLDSNLEIALKEFMVSREDLFPPRHYPDSRIRDLFQSRNNVLTEVGVHIRFSKKQLRKIRHYYGLRNKLIHERASVGITAQQISDYREITEVVLKKLFGVKFS